MGPLANVNAAVAASFQHHRCLTIASDPDFTTSWRLISPDRMDAIWWLAHPVLGIRDSYQTIIDLSPTVRGTRRVRKKGGRRVAAAAPITPDAD